MACALVRASLTIVSGLQRPTGVTPDSSGLLRRNAVSDQYKINLQRGIRSVPVPMSEILTTKLGSKSAYPFNG